MKTLKTLISGLFVSLVLAGHAETVSYNSIDSTATPDSLLGPARKIMRLSNGRIYASFEVPQASGAAPSLFAAKAADSGWINASGKLADLKAVSSASDTGPVGTYVAFVNKSSGCGELTRFPDPIGNPGVFSSFKELTPNGVTDTFVAASKGEESTNSVGYAWRGAKTGEIYFGYSADGEKFEKAKVLLKDAQLASGPILAIHNDYILLTYLTRDSTIRPKGVTESAAYPVWIESWNSGKTWSERKALFGANVTAFPRAEEVLETNEKGKRPLPLYAAGGTRVASNALAWAQPQIGARIFITTEQALVTSNGHPLESARPVVGIVSFKDLSDGPKAPWQHVFASEYQPRVTDPNAPTNTSFQYSALPGSSVRAVAYLQEGAKKEGAQGDRIAVSVSINTGKSFDRTVKFDPTSLGLKAGDRLHFTTSTCLLLKNDGNVFLDTAYVDPQSHAVQVAQLPLGINVKDLPPSLFNVGARWP